MKYSNPKIPEGINASSEHPLKEFLWLTGGVFASVVALILVLILLSDFFVRYIPFAWEQYITMPFSGSSTNTSESEIKPIEAYLQELANRISKAQELPEEMHIKVHYIDSDTVNAFATLGGHVFLFRGLLEKLTNENALGMVMAHEIAHIKFRHPVYGLGRGVAIGLVLSVISSSMGEAIMQNFVNQAGYLTVQKFSRDMERRADESAIQALLSLYGHLAGAEDLFKVLQQAHDGKEPLEFFSTHPLTDNRINNIHTRAAQLQHKSMSQVSPLPDDFLKWLKTGKSPK